jgi:hypothetical protein|tara:strand:- start:168 stop:653 length:486 start_codon:yes stop_codon:yes gene_type:complete
MMKIANQIGKKAQIEIAGLIIVIILATIGVIFTINFINEEKPADYKKEITQTGIASNMLNTFLRTTSTCKELSMTELLQDCSQSKTIACDEQDSCAYAEQEAKKIFGRTLEKWNIGYEFKAFFEEENPILILGKRCADKKSKLFPIPAGSGVLSVKMDICG